MGPFQITCILATKYSHDKRIPFDSNISSKITLSPVLYLPKVLSSVDDHSFLFCVGTPHLLFYLSCKRFRGCLATSEWLSVEPVRGLNH
ncbi:hypothetical protein HanXRQr2_Chr12g0528471 [Helianthus annuus]|uniref:Uncharacterized protein n=1 Tax=Helianthus annuus TaxID=4232 RepID=A0A9K3HER9_HELAN|nr:hypothetical protein HanXRQr2_Chr12g0528471 [Helianthus annuus]